MQITAVLLFFSFNLCAQQKCDYNNYYFKAGESVTYKTVYKLGPIWVEAGEGTFTADTAKLFGKTMYHYTGKGGTYPKYDWIYRVRDVYESYADTATLKPYRFMRDVEEGSSDFYEEDYFFHKRKKAYLNIKDVKKPLIRDTIEIDECTFDPLSAIYYARCINYKKYKINDLIPITLLISRKVYSLHIRYLGVEEIDSEFGRFRCVKFKPLLVDGTIFKGGENMTVWVTDDNNRLPLYIESELLVGTVRVYLTKYCNLRHPLAARVGGNKAKN